MTEDTRAIEAAPAPEFIDSRGIRQRFLPVDARTIERWTAAGKFPRPALRLSRRVFWRAADVREWLAAQAEGGAR